MYVGAISRIDNIHISYVVSHISDQMVENIFPQQKWQLRVALRRSKLLVSSPEHELFEEFNRFEQSLLCLRYYHYFQHVCIICWFSFGYQVFCSIHTPSYQPLLFQQTSRHMLSRICLVFHRVSVKGFSIRLLPQ